MSEAESQLMTELRALAGVKTETRFTLSHNGVPILVNYSGGSSSSLTLSVAYDEVARQAQAGVGYRDGAVLSAIRPMCIGLRSETASERRGKDAGVDVEFQSGDAAFDDTVYVDTQVPEDVLVAVLGDDVRRAVLELFAIEFKSIVIDNALGRVIASITSFASLRPAKAVGARAVDAFARLARGLPQVTRREGKHASHPLSRVNLALGALFALTFFGSFPVYCGVIREGLCQDEMGLAETAVCIGPALPGLVAGLAVGFVVFRLASKFASRYSGRSDSSSTAGAFVLLLVSLTVITTTLAVSWLLSRS